MTKSVVMRFSLKCVKDVDVCDFDKMVQCIINTE